MKMYTLLFTVFGIACGLRVAQACSCYPMGLRHALCYPGRTMFLVKAEVIGETGPLLKKDFEQWLEGMSEDEQEWYMQDYGYMRYTLAVKEIYRDDNDTIQPTSVIETWLGSSMCGMRLSVGKTYVLAGGWHVNDDNELVMDTNACEYFERYDTDVDVKMPSCENYPEPAPTNSKRAQGYAGPVNFAAFDINKRSQGHAGPVKFAAFANNKRAQGHGEHTKFDITKALGAARRALNPFRLARTRR